MFIKTKQFDYLETICPNSKEELEGQLGTSSKAVIPETGPSWLQPACVWEVYSLCVKVGQSKMEREKAECKGTERNKLAVNQAGCSKRE